MRGQIRPKKAPPYTTTPAGITQSTRDTPGNNFNDEPENGIIGTPAFEAPADDIFNSMILDWTFHDENGLPHDDFGSSILQLQPPEAAATSNTTSSLTLNHTDSSSGSVNTHSQNNDDGLIRIVQDEPPTQRPLPSPHYLGYSVAEGLESPDVFLQLTDLLVTLENLSRRLPPFHVHNLDETQLESYRTSYQSSSRSNTNQVADDDHDFGVGKTFAITNKLADIYIPLIEQTQKRKKTSHKALDPAGRPMDAVDHALLCLLFACHNRLVDLWHSMLAHAAAVHGSPRYAPNAEGRVQARCAQFSLGSYVPSSSLTVIPVEIIILQELGTHLGSRIERLIAVIDSDSTATRDETEKETISQSTAATVQAAKALHQRALHMCAEISQLKRALEESTAKPSAAA